MLIKGSKSPLLYDAYGREIHHQTRALKDDIHNVQHIEWYDNHRLVKVTKVYGKDGWARDMVLKYWHDQPRRWNQAVIHCANYARMITNRLFAAPLWADRRMILASLTNSNTYVDPNFDMDTAFNVADAITLKGGAPDVDDKFYNYNNILMTIEQALTCLLITLGDKKTGAASAGQKSGMITINAGVAVTFTGNATNTNSGIKAVPTAPGAESNNCLVTISGTAANPVTMNNSVGAINTNNRYTFNIGYGTVNINYLTIHNTYTNPFAAIPVNSTRTPTAPKINNVTSSGYGIASNFIATLNHVADMICDFRYNTIDLTGGTTPNMVLVGMGSNSGIAANGAILWSGTKITQVAGSYIYLITNYMNATGVQTAYLGKDGFYGADVRPTTVVPLDLTFTDLFDGTVKVTISNIASYRTLAANGIEDYIQLYDASGNARGGAASKTRYTATLDRKPANCFIVAGVPLSAMTGWYARATSDNNTYSAASAVASTITPELRPTANNIREGAGAGQNSAENAGAIPNSDILPASGGTCNKIYSAAEYLTREAERNYPSVGATVADVRETAAHTFAGVTYPGTLPSDKILKSHSVPGNWNDDNLGVGSEANVKLNTAYGLGQTGSLPGGGGASATLKPLDSGLN